MSNTSQMLLQPETSFVTQRKMKSNLKGHTFFFFFENTDKRHKLQ